MEKTIPVTTPAPTSSDFGLFIGDMLPLFSPDLDQLFAALSQAQGEMETALKTSYNPKFNSRYADWETVKEASRAPLKDNGLSISQPVIQLFTNYKVLYTKLGHKSGQFMASTWHLDAKVIPYKDGRKPELTDHDIARCHTYTKRYAYASIIGMSIGEDDDGNTASHRNEHDQKPPHRTYNESGSNTSNDNKSAGLTISPELCIILTETISGFSNGNWILQRVLDHNEIKSLNELPADNFKKVLKFIEDNGKN